MKEITDPYRGMKYSDIVVLDADHFARYYEAPHPLARIAGQAKASWDPTISRWVV
jgi:hypothetical protein